MKQNLVDQTCKLLKDCATIESYSILLLESSSGNILSCSWPKHNYSSDAVLLTRTWASRPRSRTWPSRPRTVLDYGVPENIKLRKVTQRWHKFMHKKHFIKQCQRLKAIKAIKLTIAWSLNCLHAIVYVAPRQWCSPRDQGLGLEAPRGQKHKSWSWSWPWNLKSWSWSWSWQKSLEHFQAFFVLDDDWKLRHCCLSACHHLQV